MLRFIMMSTKQDSRNEEKIGKTYKKNFKEAQRVEYIKEKKELQRQKQYQQLKEFQQLEKEQRILDEK